VGWVMSYIGEINFATIPPVMISSSQMRLFDIYFSDCYFTIGDRERFSANFKLGFWIYRRWLGYAARYNFVVLIL
jgi:hypothetical protein